jgi:hypothetical protein
MNRRGFLSSLAALASTSILPAVPSIPLTFYGGQVQYFDTARAMLTKLQASGIITTDIRSAYPDWRELRHQWKNKAQS